MKNILRTFPIVMACACLSSCSDFLDVPAQGVIDGTDLNTPQTVDGMCNAAYSALGNVSWNMPLVSLWGYGSIRSGDAYKGGGGTSDCSQFHQYETFSLNRIDNSYTNNAWRQLYRNISRVNDAMQRVLNQDEANYPQKQQRIAELKFLRGHFYFVLKILFKRVPYIDETLQKQDYETVSNQALTSDQLWDKIAADFRDASFVLPENQTDLGRPTKYAAEAYLAKTLLYQAYYQSDESNKVEHIDMQKLQEVNNLCDDIINSKKYDLNKDFAQNFLAEYENGIESIFAVQFSKDDGTTYGRLDMDHALNYPMAPEYSCCGFHMASHNMINAFKTENGLPMENYNDIDVAANENFEDFTFDPRLDHTVGIPGHPYKYDTDFIYQKSWARTPGVYSYYSSMKEMVAPTDASFATISPYVSSSKNWDILRYDDVLLWKAEALIELGEHKQALPLINQIRQRAANSTGRLKKADGSYISNYEITEYVDGVNCNWTQDFAREALRFERRLEFAMEGNRFFDLVRWGIADEYINHYFDTEKDRVTYYQSAFFTEDRDEYLPIPLNQINFSKGLYVQNIGW